MGWQEQQQPFVGGRSLWPIQSCPGSHTSTGEAVHPCRDMEIKGTHLTCVVLEMPPPHFHHVNSPAASKSRNKSLFSRKENQQPYLSKLPCNTLATKAMQGAIGEAVYSHLRSCVPHAQATMEKVMSQIGKPTVDSTTSAAPNRIHFQLGKSMRINISSAPSTARDSICSTSWGILRHHWLCYCCYKNLSQWMLLIPM